MTIYYQDNHVALYQGDCLDVLASMPDSSVDSIVTDPPYGLGFMGRKWDALPPSLEWAEECLRVLKPGGHIVAFGGTRTWHRLAVAIEDAGFEMRDSLAWLYGSGFPKSHDVSKGIDKLAGAEREVIGVHYRHGGGKETSGSMSGPLGTASELPLTAPATPEAAQWDGWGTALKPAFEPIVLARKPLEGTVARNVLEHGTGAINIDACRVEGAPRTTHANGNKKTSMNGYEGGWNQTDTQPGPAGRWPANVLLDEHAAAWVDEQSGWLHGRGNSSKSNALNDARPHHGSATRFSRGKVRDHGDSGGASRFFYTAKAPKSERPNVDGIQHPTVKPLAIMRWLIRLVTPPGGTVLDPFAGSGTTIEAAMTEGFHPVGIEKETDYLPLITARITRAKTSAQGVLDLGGIA